MLERHHIVFRSQLGLDFKLNYKYLTPEQHRGDNGPHLCRETDLKYKRELQEKLFELLPEEYYTVKEMRKILGIRLGQAKVFRKLPQHPEGMRGDGIYVFCSSICKNALTHSGKRQEFAPNA